MKDPREIGLKELLLHRKLIKRKKKKRLDWWVSLDGDKEENVKSLKREKPRPAREWWKEDYCDELEKKKKKKKKRQLGINSDDDWRHGGEEMNVERKKKIRSCLDWWW